MGINSRLSDLISGLKVKIVNPCGDTVVSGISADSRSIRKNDIFAAVKGVHFDGINFVESALKAGAKAVLAEPGAHTQKQTEKFKNIPFVLTDAMQEASAVLALRIYGNPSKHLKITGVTGTNGKTTVCYMLESVFKTAGTNVGVIGTINYRFNDKVIPATNTTPQAVELQRVLSEMRDNGVDSVFMEVSSHALAQQRVLGIEFDLGIFTNLTKEHLDFHKTMESYFDAKKMLFSEYIAKNTVKNKFAVINIDDEWGQRLARTIDYPAYTYSIEGESDIKGEIIKTDLNGLKMKVIFEKDCYNLNIKLLGRHNAYNALAAFGAAVESGINPNEALIGLNALENVPGRMESINLGQPYRVVVDYAHTDDALDKLISAVRVLDPKRIITVFGCGGNRDKSKRPKMGITASSNSDWVIVTSDNPRDEEPEDIIAEIVEGIKTTGRTNYETVTDREKAIRKALAAAMPGDAVILAGKGHENYQIIKNRYLDFDDRLMARKYIQKC